MSNYRNPVFYDFTTNSPFPAVLTGYKREGEEWEEGEEGVEKNFFIHLSELMKRITCLSNKCYGFGFLLTSGEEALHRRNKQ